MTNNYKNPDDPTLEDDDNIDDLPASFLNPTAHIASDDIDGNAHYEDLEPDKNAEEAPIAPPYIPQILEASDTDLRLVEAILFASPTPLSLSDIQNRLPHLATSALRPLILRLAQDYEGRGIMLEESDSRFAFRTAPDLSEHLNALRIEERPLSRAGQETLAVIAYHQPVTRPEIEAVRGVATSRGTIDALLETGWIKPGRRRESPGRPLTWVTTPTFLDHFGLETIMDLPGLDDLKASGLLDRRPTSSITADLFDNEAGDGDDVAASADDDIALQQQG